jgi:ATP-dependent RNA helicase DeaD
MQDFQSLGLKESILKGITALGFTTPTPIQEQAIPRLISNPSDLVGLAQTGTGKTAAFGLPICQLADFDSNDTQALIICPTRELCLQISRDIQSFLKFEKNARVVPIYGGASIENQIRDISRGAQIIVATPGRMVDMINRKRVKLGNVKFVVLDEADEMLNMGFKEDLDLILGETPEEKNTWLFSATMPKEVSRIAKKYMSDPFEITIGKQNSGAENIEHHFYVVHAKDRYLALKRIVDYYPDIFGIIFCRTRMETQEIADKLMRDGYNADALHGDLSQSQRDHVMNRYRTRSLQMLVATDVAARGIDVNDVTHVINYNLPDDSENYTHRSGRTARAGKSGVSVIILNTKEVGRVRELERIISQRFTQKTVPTGSEVCEKQLFSLVKKIHDAEVNEEEISDFLPPINEMLKDLSKEELIKRMVSTDFNRFLNYYRNANDLNVDSSRRDSRDRRDDRSERGERYERGGERSGRGDKGDRGSKDSFGGDRGRKNEEVTGRFFINVGEIDGMDKVGLRDYICEVAKINPSDVGRIDLRSNFTFFNIDGGGKEILDAFKNEKFNGRSIRIDNAEDKPRGERGGDRGGDRGGFGGRERSGGSDRGGYSRGGDRGGDRGGFDKPRSGGFRSGDKKEFGGGKKRKY